MRDRAEDADGDPSVAVPAVVASNFGVVVSSGSHSGTEQRPVVDTTGISHPLLVRGSLLLAAWTLSGDDMKTEAFRKEWSNYYWPAIAKPHQLLTKVPGTFGSIGALKEVKILCLLL